MGREQGGREEGSEVRKRAEKLLSYNIIVWYCIDECDPVHFGCRASQFAVKVPEFLLASWP